MSPSGLELKMPVPYTSSVNMSQNYEFNDVAHDSESESISSDASYDFADANLPNINSIGAKHPQPGDKIESAMSADSISVSTGHHIATSKNDNNSSQEQHVQVSEKDEVESLVTNGHLSKIQTQLQEHYEQMSKLFEGVPSRADAQTSIVTSKELQKQSRAIAVIFGDDISALKNTIHAHTQQYIELRVLLANEQASAKNEKTQIQERLRQLITRHHTEIGYQEVEIKKNSAKLAKALAHLRSQEKEIEKQDEEINNLCENLENMAKAQIEYTDVLCQNREQSIAALSQEHAENLKAKEAKYEAMISRIVEAAKTDLEAKDRIIHELSENDADSTAKSCQKHAKTIVELMETYDGVIKKLEEEVNDAKAVYELRVSEEERKEQEYANLLENAILKRQQETNDCHATLQKTHDLFIAQKDEEIAELKAQTEKTSHIVNLDLAGAYLNRISDLNSELRVTTTKIETYRHEKETKMASLKDQNETLAARLEQAEAQIRCYKSLTQRGILTQNIQGETVKTIQAHPIPFTITPEKIQTVFATQIHASQKQVATLNNLNSTLSQEVENRKSSNEGLVIVLDTLQDRLQSVIKENKAYEQELERIRERLSRSENKLIEEFHKIKVKSAFFEKEAETAKAKVAELESERSGIAYLDRYPRV